jgi:hypothetical protein
MIATGGTPNPPLRLAYLALLFEDPEPLIFEYSGSQIAQGLTCLVNTNASGDIGWFYATAAPIEDRVRSVEAVASLFAQLFEPRCTPHLSHLSETDAGSLNSVCYIWWESGPLWLCALGSHARPEFLITRSPSARNAAHSDERPVLKIADVAPHCLIKLAVETSG